MAKTKRTAARQSQRVREKYSKSFDETVFPQSKAARVAPRGRKNDTGFMAFVHEFPWLTGIISAGLVLTLFFVMMNNHLGPFAPAPDTSCDWAKNPIAVHASNPIMRHYASAPKSCITKTTKGVFTAIITLKKGGTITLTLDQKQAPLTVNNFVFLATHHFYDSVTFHRADTGVIQGGDPNTADPKADKSKFGQGGPGYKFADELPSSSAVYKEGCLAMANSGTNTNGSQFFICIEDDTNKFTANYSSFGTVTGGLDVAKQVQAGDAMTGITIHYNAHGTVPSSAPTATPAK